MSANFFSDKNLLYYLFDENNFSIDVSIVDDEAVNIEEIQETNIESLTKFEIYSNGQYIETVEDQSEEQVKELLNKKAYKAKDFQKTYDSYNTASTFLGGMSNNDNFEASILFSKIMVT